MGPTRQFINSSGHHTVQICLTEDTKIDLVTGYIKDGLINNEAVFIISEPKLRKTLRLKTDGFSLDGQAFQGINQVRFFDAAYLLLLLKPDDKLEEEIFQENIATLLHNARSEYKNARVCEEMADILWKQEEHDVAIQTAGVFETLANTQGFPILSIYSLGHLDLDSYDNVLEQIGKYHPDSTPQKHYGLTEQGVDKSMDAFEAAWERLVAKIVH